MSVREITIFQGNQIRRLWNDKEENGIFQWLMLLLY